MNAIKSKEQYVLVVSLFFSLAIVYYLFSSSFFNEWFFDDHPTMKGLSAIENWSSTLLFIKGGIASDIGRPLSNLSFLLNLSDWVANYPAGFRKTTLLFHLLNTVLVFVLVRMCARQVTALSSVSDWFGLAVAFVWAVHPINFTPVLMPVQRMTILAGSFSLLGLIGYVYGRSMLQGERWLVGGIVLCFSIVCCSLLGVLTKENAALLPFFAAVIEFTLFRGKSVLAPPWLWRAAKFFLFVVPGLILLLFFYIKWDGFTRGFSFRAYSMEERIATQAVILWDYVRLIVIPNVSSYTPFHDDFPIYSMFSWQPIVAFVGWLGVISYALVKRSSEWYIFLAVGFFLVGHTLESTVVPLEMYFEHRNYLPSLGIIAVLLGLCFTHEKRSILVGLLIGVLLFTSWRVTDLWRKPLLAAHMQVQNHPTSIRAITFAGISYETNYPELSYKVIRDGVEAVPYALSLQLTHLQESCSTTKENVGFALDFIQQNSPHLYVDYIPASTESLEGIYRSIKDKECYQLDRRGLLLVIDNILANEAIWSNNRMRYRLFFIKSSLHIDLHEDEKAVKAMKEAFKARRMVHLISETALMMNYIGQKEEALEYIVSSYHSLNWNKVANEMYWKQKIINSYGAICVETSRQCDSATLMEVFKINSPVNGK